MSTALVMTEVEGISVFLCVFGAMRRDVYMYSLGVHTKVDHITQTLSLFFKLLTP